MSSQKGEDKEKKMTRRGFIKWSTALAAVGAAAVGAVAGYGSDLLLRPTTERTTTQTATTTVTVPPPTLSYKPPLSPEAQTRVDGIVNQLVQRHAGETTTYTSINVSMGGYETLIKVRMKGGKIVAVEGDDTINTGVAREDAALSQDSLMKVKIQTRPKANAYAYPPYLTSPTRILYPMKRVGARGDPNGTFVRISWGEALDTVANKINDVKTKYGPYSIGYFYSWAGLDILPYINAGVHGWGNVSYGAQDHAALFVFGEPDSWPGGSGQGSIAGQITDIFNSKLIVLWACDPTTAGTGTASNITWYVRLAKEKGIPIIVIDPKYTMAAEALADQWIPIRPGTDVAMMLAVANELFKQNLYNQGYVAKYVEPTGFQKWKNYVLGNTAGPDGAIDRTPEWAEKITGVPAETIRGFARLYAASNPTFLVYYWGGSRQPKGENVARAGAYLQAMTGNIGIAGGNVSFSYGGFGGISSPSPAYGRKAGTYTPVPAFKTYKWADTVLLRDQYDSGALSKADYYSIIGNAPNNPAPNLKMVFTKRSELSQIDNVNKTIQAVKKLEMVVAMTWHWKAEAKLADIVLPQTEPFEVNMGFMRIQNGLTYCPRLVKEQGEARPLDWIYSQLAKRLGFLDSYMPLTSQYSGWDTDPDVWDRMISDAMKAGYQTWASSSTVKSALGTVPTWEDFLKSPVIHVETPIPATYPYKAQIDQGTKFKTKSGLIEFYSDYLATTDMKNTKWGGPMAPMAIYEPIPNGFYDPKIQKYPLLLIDTHNRYKGHTCQDSDPYLRGEIYRHAVWINPADAKARGIRDNDLVRVFNDTGELTVPAYVTSRVVPGVVNIYDGAWYQPNASGVDRSGCTNVLSADTFNADAQDPHLDPVEIEKQ